MIRIVLPLLLLYSVLLVLPNAGLAQDPGLPLDPVVESIVASVSPDTILSNLETLVDFYTRHTNSDTVSTTTGIGAARRWIYSRFVAYSAGAADLLPGYFTFDAAVCGISGEHRNVTAILPGTMTPDRFFVSMGHMDDRSIGVCDNLALAPGANDDGSGTAVTMEMARVMSPFLFESTVILMPVTGEDQGLYGSQAYADWAEEQGLDIDGVLTNDVVGNIEGCVDPGCPPGEPVIIDSTSVRHFSGGEDTGVSRQLSRYMKMQAGRYVPGFEVNLISALDRPGRSGDHVPFFEKGYPAVRFTEPNENGDGTGANGRQHNENDTISYYNTNKTYMANIARISAAGFASLALAPDTPEGLEGFDGGDGQSLLLTWSSGQTEPDFMGYMVTRRDPDMLYYSSFVDVGSSTQHTVTGLVEGEPVNFSVAAYDSSGNLSMFSEEIQLVPSSLPGIPQNLDATSHASIIDLQWDPNTELDLERYRIYRSTDRYSGFVPYDSVSVPLAGYTDNGAVSHTMYYYQIRAVDMDGNESPPSETVQGRLATLDLGILLVDGTTDGTGTVLGPTDQQVDEWYLTLLGNFDVSHYDIADSLDSDIRLSDADFSAYSTVLWHTDVRGSSPVREDTTAIRKYLSQGGKLILCGWKLSTSLKFAATTGLNTYTAGTFVPDYLKVDSTYTSGAILADFITAIGQGAGYPDVTVDSAKIPLYGGALVNTDVVLPPFADPSVQTLYTHHGVAGSVLEGKPVGWRVASAVYDIIVFDFPFYYMQETSASTALRQALFDMGEVTAVDDGLAGVIPQEYRLYPNYPNPFNPSTEIRYDLPEPAAVTLTVYDMLGQKVRVLVGTDQSAGRYMSGWDGRNGDGIPVSSGIYFYELRAIPDGGPGRFYSDIGTMVLIK